MDDQRKQQHLHDVDRVLTDVREHLSYQPEEGDTYELRALQLLLEVTKAMHTQHNVQSLIALILDSALSFAEADRAFLMLINNQGDLRFKMGRSYEGDYLSQDEFVISNSVVQQAIASQEPLILADTQADDDFATRQSIVDLKLRTIMVGPLRYKGDLLGLLYVDSKRPLARYSKHHLNVLTSLSDQAAIAIVNARKFETHH